MNHLPPKEGIIFRLTIQPECLDMESHSLLDGGTLTFCIAGLILAAANVDLEYGPDGFAMGLGQGETPPSEYWLDFEVSISASRVDRDQVIIPAKAREIWAEWYGEEQAKRLPFYGADWGRKLSEVTPQNVMQILEILARTYRLPN